DRDSQTILAWGLLFMLMMDAPEVSVVSLFGEMIPLLPVIAMLLACLVLIADRCGELLLSRLALLLLPLMVIVPVMFFSLQFGQGPVISALGDLLPRSREVTPTGFSPYQTLRASVFLRPSNRAVMRIETEAPPSRYLAGNRLVLLDEELIWLPSQRALRAYSTVDAELLEGGEWRYAIENNQFGADNLPQQQMTIHALANDDFLFVTPGTSHVSGRFTAINRNAADVWTPAYDRGADQRWTLETGGIPQPDAERVENLLLPSFWDESLQQKSEGFVGPDRQQTVDNILNHFVSRGYTLQTDFDRTRPFHDFYLNDRDAYCFWFATAATLALRANDIPSRLVGGYVIHEQLSEDLWLVRERDAHSWVEWQDAEGYWHSIDPTPPSISSFFGGYESSQLSVWYHTLAGQWQRLIDRILEDEFTANLVRYGGLAILVFLFGREYRRIRQARGQLDTRALRWQKLWRKFLSVSRLPDNPAWTTSTYEKNLPGEWPDERKVAVKEFLESYARNRFGNEIPSSLQDVEISLKKCSRTLATNN
ncbi:MAG: transglutaminase domain-containing protein, partial [Gammaproteobacteria bacterium]